jgi:hypothetical protein
MLAPTLNGIRVPARQTYAHIASVGSRASTSAPRACSSRRRKHCESRARHGRAGRQGAGGIGHNHILVDALLPLDVSDKIPFSDTHRHFGKGQTMTVLDLTPGKHTLRLLFADHDHKPYFVYSPEITVEVTGARTAKAPKIDTKTSKRAAKPVRGRGGAPAPPGEWMAIANLRGGETVASPFNVRFTVDRDFDKPGGEQFDRGIAGALRRAEDAVAARAAVHVAVRQHERAAAQLAFDGELQHQADADVGPHRLDQHREQVEAVATDRVRPRARDAGLREALVREPIRVVAAPSVPPA